MEIINDEGTAVAEYVKIDFGYEISAAAEDSFELTDAMRQRMETLTEASHAQEEAAGDRTTPQAS